jgi:TolB protein
MSMITRRDLGIGIAAVPLFMSTARLAHAELHIDLTRGNIKPMPIAIPVFAGGGGTIGSDITGVLSADLERSGLFQPIDSKAFVDQDANSHIPPSLGYFRRAAIDRAAVYDDARQLAAHRAYHRRRRL